MASRIPKSSQSHNTAVLMLRQPAPKGFYQQQLVEYQLGLQLAFQVLSKKQYRRWKRLWETHQVLVRAGSNPAPVDLPSCAN